MKGQKMRRIRCRDPDVAVGMIDSKCKEVQTTKQLKCGVRSNETAREY